MDIAPQTVFIELINFETWEVPNFLSSNIIIIRLRNFHPALWVVMGDGQQIGGGAVSRGLSLVYSEICMFKQMYKNTIYLFSKEE